MLGGNGGGGDGRVAVYWDFENLHIQAGSRDRLVDVSAVVTYAASFGTIVINRAYANWQRFSRYAEVMHTNALDLVQLFDVAHTKNGADIRLAADAVADRFLLPNLTHVIIVSTDSDFTGLARRLREMDTTVVGVVTRKATAAWRHSCHEFRYYDDLVARTGAPQISAPAKSAEFPAAKRLLLRAANQLFASQGQEEVAQGHVYQLMKRLDPAFDYSRLGFRTFGRFVEEAGKGALDVERPADRGDYRVRATSATAEAAAAAADESSDVAERAEVVAYRSSLVDRKIVVPPAPLNRSCTENLPELRVEYPDRVALDDALAEQLRPFVQTARDVPSLRHLLTVGRVIERFPDGRMVFRTRDPQGARERVIRQLADVLVRVDSAAVDVDALYDLAFGPDVEDKDRVVLERLTDEALGGSVHRINVAFRRIGLELVPASAVAELAAAITDGRLDGTWPDGRAADTRIAEVVAVDVSLAAKLRSVILRAKSPSAASDAASPITITGDDGGEALYEAIGRLVATEPCVVTIDEPGLLRALEVLELDPGSAAGEALERGLLAGARSIQP